jgi:hypothetical protein
MAPDVLSMKRPRLHHVSAALDGDVLLVIDLVNYRRCVSTKTGLELPQHLAGLGVDRYKVAVGFATKQETPWPSQSNRRHRPCDMATCAATRSCLLCYRSQ